MQDVLLDCLSKGEARHASHLPCAGGNLQRTASFLLRQCTMKLILWRMQICGAKTGESCPALRFHSISVCALHIILALTPEPHDMPVSAFRPMPNLAYGLQKRGWWYHSMRWSCWTRTCLDRLCCMLEDHWRSGMACSIYTASPSSGGSLHTPVSPYGQIETPI